MSTTPNPINDAFDETAKKVLAEALFKLGNSDAALALLGKDAPYPNGLASSQTEYWLGKFEASPGCEAVKKLKDDLRLLSNVNDSVILTGPTGSGKELLARSLHSARKGKYVPVNCAGLPEHLAESELFGHRKGAFTGAITDKAGLCEEAGGGSLFLDEIGELPLAIQAKFLRTLQEKVVRPVGSNEEKPVSFRVIAATHHNMSELVSSGKFREDLYARLSVFELGIPSIKERGLPESIYLLRKLAESPEDKAIPASLLATFNSRWEAGLPHNYRDLQKIVRRWQVLENRKVESLI